MNDIHEGSTVLWNPPQGNLYQMFPRNTAFRLYHMVPIPGIVKHVSREAALMSFMGPKGKEEIPVLLAELTRAVMAHD